MKLFGLEISIGRAGGNKRLPRIARRNYDAATTPLFAETTSNSNINAALSQQLPRLRSMSRNEARNNPLGARYVNLCRTNVVGPQGVVVQAQSVDNNGQFDSGANDAIETAWKDWGRPGNCDASETLSWVDLQRLVVTSLITDGEGLIEEVDTGPYRYGLNLSDCTALDVMYSGRAERTGNRVIMGVELDNNWRPVAYYLLGDPATAPHYIDWTGYARRRIPAERLRHIYFAEAVGQVRGVPWLVPALLRAKMLDGFSDAALTNARAGAAKMGFYTSPDGEPMTGDEMLESGDFVEFADPGVLQTLPPGYGFQNYDPTYPSGEFEAFAADHKRDISSALSVGYNSLTNDLRGVSYSSIRTAVLEDRENWKMVQNFLIERLVRPTFEAWLLSALAEGMVTLENGSPLPVVKYDKFKTVNYQGRRWSWIDPLKDISATEKAIQNQLTSRRRAMLEQGLDPEEIWAELAEEEAALTANQGDANG